MFQTQGSQFGHDFLKKRTPEAKTKQIPVKNWTSGAKLMKNFRIHISSSLKALMSYLTGNVRKMCVKYYCMSLQERWLSKPVV